MPVILPPAGGIGEFYRGICRIDILSSADTDTSGYQAAPAVEIAGLKFVITAADSSYAGRLANRLDKRVITTANLRAIA